VTASDDRAKPASAITGEANAEVGRRLPLDDQRDFDRARRGLIATPSSRQVIGDGGFPVWNLDDYSFLDGAPPDTVNPSLWRQARLNATAGLFEVADGFYQVRGLDLANVTFVATHDGWLVIDPLTSRETARAALDLVHDHLPERPVAAIIYTHSHVDHFGGVRGIVDEHDVVTGRVPVIAPAGFLRAAISENVIAGNVMGRRASYMYGPLLPRDPQGHVDAGLGKGIPLLASTGLIPPTVDITETGTEVDIGGVRLVFQLTPGTEAPAEMNFFFPQHRLLCMAENCTANLHNLYTPRGAEVRDALGWSKYIQEAIELFAASADAVFASHHWPRWGNDDVVDYLRRQRDLYRYLHDQTMRLANRGETMLEIAEQLELPAGLADEFFARDYYGTVSHNAKAVYQRYLGWFDGNPANLHPLPPVEAGRRYVEFMGGADEVLRKARAAFDDGDYRWVAQVVNHVVFADPSDVEARRLQADTFEQLGYQCESGPWRDFYLTGAQELRQGPFQMADGPTTSLDVARAMTTEMLVDLMGVRLDGPAAGDTALRVNVVVSDRDERHVVGLERGTLHHVAGRLDDEADVTITLPHLAFAALASGRGDLDELVARREVEIDGRREALDTLLGLLEDFEFGFPMVTP
jgi:alkyl sulfatase BDS1-like metallo-beta-lactamase superfamily hydrolase